MQFLISISVVLFINEKEQLLKTNFFFVQRNWDQMGNKDLVLMSKAAAGGDLLKESTKTFAKFTEEHLCQSLFFNKVYLKRDPGTGVFL